MSLRAISRFHTHTGALLAYNLFLFMSAFAHAQIRLTETGAGTDYLSLQAPAAIATSFTLTMPAADGTANQCLVSNGSGALQWRTAASGYSLDAVDGSPTNAVYVDSNGNVGIGTTSPGSTLQVNGQFSNQGNAYISGGFGQFVEINMNNGIASYFAIKNGGADVLRVPTGTSPGAGNVGIGTTNPQAALEVRGEIRTTSAAGVGRLWGRGRPSSARYGTTGSGTGLCTNGAVTFGLSYSTANWGGADAVCPLGTWVCTAAERGTAACNTARPDGTTDGADCTGAALNWAATAHLGWVADAGGFPSSGFYVNETGATVNSAQPCNNLAVWCCN